MNIYTFTGVAFVPGYNDFDQEWVNITAQTEAEARTLLSKLKIYWKGSPEVEKVEPVA
jgi:hypothetical protein